MNTERFFSSVAAGAGGAGLESYVELWNPAGSGKTAKVMVIKINTKSTVITFITHTAQQGAAGSAGMIANKDLLGNNPVCQLYGHSLLAVLGTDLIQMMTTADVTLPTDLSDSPFIVKPGQSFIIENATANQAINMVHIAWHEIDNKY